jgi:hypothetical protein
MRHDAVILSSSKGEASPRATDQSLPTRNDAVVLSLPKHDRRSGSVKPLK